MKAILIAAVAVGLAAPAATGATRGFNACKTLQDSFSAYWKSKVVTSSLAEPPSFRVYGGGRIYACEWVGRRLANGGFDYAVRFNLTVSASVAAAAQAFALMHANPKNVKEPVAGADDAYGYQERAGADTTSTVAWRRGRYAGTLGTLTPGERGLLDAKAMLETFLRRLPKG